MKKFLLSLGCVAAAATAGATNYTVFDITNKGEWAGGANGYNTVVSFGDVKFNLASEKAGSSTDLISPVDNNYSWRVYKGSKISVSSETVTIKQAVITYDDGNNNKYVLAMNLGEGWTGTLDNAVYTCVNNAGGAFEGQAANGQVRISKIVVSDTVGDTSEPLTPSNAGTPGGDTPVNPPTDPEITGFTVFDIASPGTWEGGANGWTNTTTIGGKTFNLSTAKADSSQDLISPVANTFAWRVYKGSTFTIASDDCVMKNIVITYDNYNEGQYCLELTLPEGWTGVLNGDTYTLTCEAGASSFTGKAEGGQVRIKTVLVSDGEEHGPVLPEGVLYQNAFDSSIDDWTKVNDTTVGDYNGWKINSTPKCAIANSYYEGANHAAIACLEKTFNLAACTDVAVSFEQGFGYFFPTEQDEHFRVYVTSNGDKQYLSMSNYPAAPESGNWTKTWEKNEFDLSEYDGTEITFGFEYNNPGGATSMAWEVKNFILAGKGALSGVAEIATDEDAAPVYYNLQGVRVANPEKGLYIVVKGSKSSKVVF